MLVPPTGGNDVGRGRSLRRLLAESYQRIARGLTDPRVRVRQRRAFEKRPDSAVADAREGGRGSLANARLPIGEQPNHFDDRVVSTEPVEPMGGEDPDHPVTVRCRLA